MTLEQWLPLAEYSSKFKVSVSTLRRRIKADDIKYKFDDGKYFILTENQQGAPQGFGEQHSHRPSQDDVLESSLAHLAGAPENSIVKDEPILTAANRLLKELQESFEQRLADKDQQILKYRKEIADLKTLVQVLENK